jgi:hypothetical protein
LEDNRRMWKGDITWDELQIAKSQCGRGNKRAFEIYPENSSIIYAGNYRHLWIPANNGKFPELLMTSKGIINISNDPKPPRYTSEYEYILKGDWRS